MDERLPAPVRWLLIANVVAFLITAIVDKTGMLGRFSFTAAGALIPAYTWHGFQFWRLFTYMFLHGGIGHLLVNMLTLWMLGPQLCWRLGNRGFTMLYFVSGLTAGVFSLAFYLVFGQEYTAIVGASGALFGLIVAFARFYPDQPFNIMFFFTVPARYAVWIFGATSLYFSFFALGSSGVAHATHLFGILGGLVYLRFDETVSAAVEKMETWRERKVVQKAVEELINHEEFYDTRIDPILKKISKHGMDSLTKQERDVLDKASKRKRPDNAVDLERWRRDNDR